jgi:processive 1,2-diacylglycerol beta-glucosyltransferase
MRIFYFAPENSGVAYYRFYQPLTDLRERGLIELHSWGFDFTDKKFELPSYKELKEIADWADIFIVGRQDTPEWFNLIKILKEFAGKKVFLDIDDNIFSITPYLPAHIGYNPNGQAIKIHEEIAKLVDGIICSTPFLQEIYKKYNKTWLVPNGVKYLLPKKRHEGINIGYLCSGSHLENAQIVEPAIIRILKKYSNVTFYYTKAFQGFMDRVPESIQKQINYLPFFPLKDYLKYVNNLGLDIGIAPLMENDFNRAKSNIRILEYWQNQMAVIASPLDEYSKTIQHGYNGYLSENDEWDSWIEDLLTHPERRDYLARNGINSLANYDISKSAQIYYEILRETIK